MRRDDKQRGESAAYRFRLRKKQVGVYIEREDWLRLREHAARQGVPMTKVFWEQMRPLLDQPRSAPAVQLR